MVKAKYVERGMRGNLIPTWTVETTCSSGSSPVILHQSCYRAVKLSCAKNASSVFGAKGDAHAVEHTGPTNSKTGFFSFTSTVKASGHHTLQHWIKFLNELHSCKSWDRFGFFNCNVGSVGNKLHHMKVRALGFSVITLSNRCIRSFILAENI